MPTLAKRKLIKFGESGLVLTVPKAWARYYNLMPGDKVEIEANGELVVRPETPKRQANEETDK
ncbi:unnamed protein product [marine sediment metagenome]|uniref:SpoVT-AbrB domain-containing protein n=1 Tax=marine sediment metagenome TaxID=412755 RepID=X1TKR7_9ZZZZ